MKKTTAICISTFMLLSSNLLHAETKVSQVVEAPKTKIINIKLPKVPEVPKVMAVVPVVKMIVDGKEVSSKKILEEFEEPEETHETVMVFSNRVPPGYNNKDKNEVKKAQTGDIENGRVAAYLHTALMSVEDVKANLTKAGFDIVATYKLDKKGKATSIVFTNKAMQTMASKKSRGFASTLRAVVDTKNKITSISNPIYVMKAFMQKEYDNKLATSTLKSLRDNFEGLKNSKEIVKFRVLERFHFMENMPYYQDMKIVGKGTNDALMKKAKKSKKIIYSHKLANGSYTMGVKLGKRTSKFIKKTGYTNAGLLPYPVLIEDGEAKILAPQYYIAVMYPMLKLSQFMKIATVPGAIEKDCDRIFR